MEVVPHRSRRRASGDAGQLLPLVALVVALGGLAAFGLVRLAVVARDYAAATKAADAAALSAASAPERADDVAREVAEANGARVVEVARVGADVRVRVELGSADATARARSTTPPEGAAATALAPAMRA
ncbi:MAG TPA: hypothetical protein VF230_01755, partial [Acidimicrobiales bacterium]